VDVLATYPLSKVEAPKKNAARERYETIENDERIVRAASEEMRGLFAFVKGTGCDLTTAINTPAREINLATGTARLKGTKTAKRDVHKALIESWAIPYLRAALHGVMANAKPWAAITRSRAAKHHAACCEAVEIEGYTLKDARHSVAVRMLEAGYDIYAVAEQLGNTPELVARVYGQHQPKMAHKVTESVTEAAK
jgi:integrase